ncbi:MAG: FecR domain-containing protein, partial [Beijerinckiaceae bacterium]|nr:FecR domain-containing protein [Beijerinckiaceae bacterium]
MAGATIPDVNRRATGFRAIRTLVNLPRAVSAVTGLAFAGMAASAGKVSAQNAIGGTIVVQNDVRSQNAGKRNFLKLQKGAHVFQDDLVRTQEASLTKIVFLDKTNMSVGPESEARLDKFVYNGDGTAKDVVIEAAKGTFRFFSGNSSSAAYRVLTPRAVIGVRGTAYDVRITPDATMVVLQEGEVNVCVRNTANCRVLNQPGQSVNVNDAGITDPIPPAGKTWDFASLCVGSASVLCARTTQFALAPAPPPAAAPKPAARPKPTNIRPPARRARAKPVRKRTIRP